MATLYYPAGLIESPIKWALCRTPKDFRKALKQLGEKQSDYPEFLATDHAHATVHFVDSKQGKYALVCFAANEKIPLPVRVGLLAHEAVHIWQRIRAHMGEVNPSAEFEAYAVQRITQDLVQGHMEDC